jgi:hypothetical protein
MALLAGRLDLLAACPSHRWGITPVTTKDDGGQAKSSH